MIRPEAMHFPAEITQVLNEEIKRTSAILHAFDLSRVGPDALYLGDGIRREFLYAAQRDLSKRKEDFPGETVMMRLGGYIRRQIRDQGPAVADKSSMFIWALSSEQTRDAFPYFFLYNSQGLQEKLSPDGHPLQKTVVGAIQEALDFADAQMNLNLLTPYGRYLGVESGVLLPLRGIARDAGYHRFGSSSREIDKFIESMHRIGLPFRIFPQVVNGSKRKYVVVPAAYKETAVSAFNGDPVLRKYKGTSVKQIAGPETDKLPTTNELRNSSHIRVYQLADRMGLGLSHEVILGSPVQVFRHESALFISACQQEEFLKYLHLKYPNVI